MTLELLGEMLEKTEEVRRQLTERNRPNTGYQVACHGFRVQMVRSCSGLVAASFEGLSAARRIETVARLARCVVGATADELHMLHAQIRFGEKNTYGDSLRRNYLCQTEAVLQLPGLLSIPDDTDVVLSTDPDDPVVCFRDTLASVRTHPNYADIGRAIGESMFCDESVRALLDRLASDLDPSSEHDAVVRALAQATGHPELYDSFLRARAAVGDRSTRSKNRDIRFLDFVEPVHALVERVFALEAKRQEVPRAGRRRSRGELAENSKRTYRQMVGHFLAAAQLPASSTPARQRGLGWSVDRVSLLTAINPDVIHACDTLLRARRETGDSPQRGDTVYFSKLADLCRKGGTMWQLADKLASANPRSAEWLLTNWPTVGEVDRPGAPCANHAERVRAQCLASRALLLALAQTARNAPPSPGHLRRMGELARRHRFPLVGLYRLLLRVFAAQKNCRDGYYDALILSYLALASLCPPRISDGVATAELQLQKCRDESSFIFSLVEPTKNPGSRNARGKPKFAVPEPLGAFVRPFHDFRGSAKSTEHYYVTPDGSPLSKELLRFHLERVALKFAPDIFPFGIGAHDPRGVVGTELAARFGLRAGGELAGLVLRDHAQTVRDSYVFLTGLPEEVVLSTPPCHSDAIGRAFCEAVACDFFPRGE